MLYPWELAPIIGGVAALIITIILYVTVMSRKKDGKFKSGFAQGLHNFFNFKKLILESILKFIYVLATIASVTIGFFMLFGYQSYFGYYSFSYNDYMYKETTALVGIILMLAGPIVIRLAFEILMMGILLVKNVIDINNKLRVNTVLPENAPQQPVNAYQQNVQPAFNQAVSYNPPVQPNFTNQNTAPIAAPMQANIPVPNAQPVAPKVDYFDLEKTQAAPPSMYGKTPKNNSAPKSSFNDDTIGTLPFDFDN